MKRKTLQELTITDAFMFAAVMEDPENCRLLLERILEIPIERVVVSTEKSMAYRPEYKGIRLDVYAKDDKGTRFDVEMQVRSTPIEKRSRYYHSQMDMEMLLGGTAYEDLPDSFVIFLCCFDHFEQGKYRYTIDSHCLECPEIDIKDGIHTIILNNKGMNPDEVPAELVSFLEYTKKPLSESECESDDAFIKRLQDTIHQIKNNRTMEEKYMQFQEMLQEEYEQGLEEGISEGRQRYAFDLVLRGKISIEDAAEDFEFDTEELKQKLEEYLKAKKAETNGK